MLSSFLARGVKPGDRAADRAPEPVVDQSANTSVWRPRSESNCLTSWTLASLPGRVKDDGADVSIALQLGLTLGLSGLGMVRVASDHGDGCVAAYDGAVLCRKDSRHL